MGLIILNCGWTIDFGSEQVTGTQNDIQNGWYNYDDYKKYENSESIQKRAIFAYIDKIIPKYEKKAYNGVINFHPHKRQRFTVTNQARGVKINREKLCDDIYNKKENIKAEYVTVYPKTKKEILSGIVKRGTAATHFEENPPRNHNIALAVKRFDGLVVYAGEEISFNKIVGSRTESRGYQEAKIIIAGEYVPGIGGGVCQVSTTLFNALADAGLHITESHNHTLPSGYVPLGKDAMVSSDSDLRFVNNSGSPIYFETGVNDNNVYVNIYGRTKGANIRYELAADITKEYLPDKIPDDTIVMPESLLINYKKNPDLYDRKIMEEGHKGYAVTTYIETYKGDRLLNKKFLRKSVYRPQPTKYRIVPKIINYQEFVISQDSPS
jgi:vancomycin resistance protein YoaR